MPAEEGTVATVNRLIEAARDAEDGFRTAGAAVSDPHLRHVFTAHAREHAELVRELSECVQRFGGMPLRRGSVAGALHRALVNLHAAVGTRDERAFVADAQRAESAAVTAYRGALASGHLRGESRELVARQAARVEAMHEALRQLERAA
jgi:uncharacterized protein (TIGR02284 family)